MKKGRKGAKKSDSKCQMLAYLGIDYLSQFAKKYDLKINAYLGEVNKEQILSLIERVLLDSTKTEAIEISIAFYLLNLQELSPSEQCAKMLHQLLDSAGITPNVKWVSFSIFELFIQFYSSFFRVMRRRLKRCFRNASFFPSPQTSEKAMDGGNQHLQPPPPLLWFLLLPLHHLLPPFTHPLCKEHSWNLLQQALLPHLFSTPWHCLNLNHSKKLLPFPH